MRRPPCTGSWRSRASRVPLRSARARPPEAAASVPEAATREGHAATPRGALPHRSGTRTPDRSGTSDVAGASSGGPPGRALGKRRWAAPRCARALVLRLEPGRREPLVLAAGEDEHGGRDARVRELEIGADDGIARRRGVEALRHHAARHDLAALLREADDRRAELLLVVDAAQLFGHRGVVLEDD